jgi:hypothetical protein
MKLATICSLLLLISAECVSDQYGNLAAQDVQFSYNVDYTEVSIHNYRAFKLTAQQNTTNNQLLVIAYPEKAGIRFTIQGVQMGESQQNDLQGLVATVTGTLSVQTNEPQPLQVPLTVAVQISQVSQFSVSPQEAMMQGLQFFTTSP